ncbi:pentatricopeptide repeat-containing protein At2g35030, mitochondrial [Humulus lupulus]|uniref:pentatricopeptide repeat-containing protein At2g35030, mitochondrial n=1 Tax=Humulus lupulus TaxID=3486 RepID=UPI002B40257D|nr:pentatricopeptide repeat-containing protein At2g35030, mitochondrial [Humulus lupulus]
MRPKHLLSSFAPITITSRGDPRVVHYSTEFKNAPKITLSRKDYSANSEVARSNWLITKLSRDGKIYEARKVFDEMPETDVITWTTVITGYVKCGMIEEARKLFDRIDAKKDVITWTTMISGYKRMEKIDEAERLFLEMPEKNVISCNTMIEVYSRNGQVDLALDLFERMQVKNVVSWNTIITGLAQRGRIEDARRIFNLMPERDVISWTTMVTSLSRNGMVGDARVLFDRMPIRNVVSWNTMITGYAQNMRLNEAFELFQRMPERNMTSWNTMITGFIKNGELKRAWNLFNEMPHRNSISWTAMITSLIQDGKNEEALKMFSKMVAVEGMKPNEATFVSVLSACSNLAGLGEGQQIHQMISKTVYQDSEILVSALINMYSKCGKLSSARKMFDDGLTSHRDLVSWNGMIAAYAHHGFGLKAIKLFDEMRGFGFKPNDVTYVGLLSACSHAGLVEEGLLYFDVLVRDGSIQVREDHYTCYVDLCGRAGKLNQAFDFIERLGTKASATIWGALLAGCNVYGDMNIGKLAAEKILEGEPDSAGTYLLLSNIYASSGKWREAAKVRLKMKEKGLKKQPGCSWIEVGNRVHVFVVGDKSNNQSKLIYSLLTDLHEKMKKLGYVSNNDLSLDEDVSVT